MPTINLDPYLFFPGNCAEAMAFYHSVFGGKLEIQTIGEAMGDAAPADRVNYIMHAHLSGGLVSFMASDSDRTEPYPASFITLSLGGSDEIVLTDLFTKLSNGGEITSPLKKESWGDTFGTVTDAFGTEWMVNITSAGA